MSTDPRSRRHSATVMAEARRLAEAGWNAPRIVRILRVEHGVVVHRDTVRRWTDATFAEKEAARVQARNRKVWAERWTFQLGGHSPSPEYQAAFVRRLRAEGMPWEGIARCCRVVFGGTWTAHAIQQLAVEAEDVAA